MKTLRKPLSSDSDVQDLVKRITLSFPIPIKKPPFQLVYPASLGESERQMLQEIYERLPNVSPEDFETVASPIDYAPEIFIGYASCFLISSDRTNLGLDPYDLGLCSNLSEPPVSGLDYILRFLFRGSVDVGDRLEQSAIKSILASSTKQQQSCLIEYLKMFNSANHGVLSKCVERITTLPKQDRRDDMYGPESL